MQQLLHDSIINFFYFIIDADWLTFWKVVLLPFIQVAVWPLTVIFGLVLFKRIVAYLFLSMESFNFFGAKGTIRPAHEVIEERAKMMRDEEKRDQEYKATISKIDSKDLEASEYKRIAHDILKRNNELTLKLSESEVQRKRLEFEAYNHVGQFATPNAAMLQQQIDALLAQVQRLQEENPNAAKLQQQIDALLVQIQNLQEENP